MEMAVFWLRAVLIIGGLIGSTVTLIVLLHWIIEITDDITSLGLFGGLWRHKVDGLGLLTSFTVTVLAVVAPASASAVGLLLGLLFIYIVNRKLKDKGSIKSYAKFKDVGFDDVMLRDSEQNKDHNLAEKELGQAVTILEGFAMSAPSAIEKDVKELSLLMSDIYEYKPRPDTFASYIVPETIKFIDRYCSVSKRYDLGTNEAELEQLRGAISLSVTAFKKYLHALRELDDIDMQSDIKVFEQVTNISR